MKQGTRIRKISRLFKELSDSLNDGETPDLIYIRGLGDLIVNEELPGEFKDLALSMTLWEGELSMKEMARFCDNYHYRLSSYLGITPGDWDLRVREGVHSSGKRIVHPFRIYLDDIRSPFNVGSIFRTSEAFGVEQIGISPATPSPEHPRAARTSMGCGNIIPWKRGGIDMLEDEPAVFALELGGADISEFVFPEEGTVILGSEELGISSEAQNIVSRKNGIVSIPMRGIKGSVNVSVAFGILMYAWNQSAKKT